MRAFFHIIIPLAIIGLGLWVFSAMKDLKKSGFKLNKDKEEALKKRPEAPKIQSRVLALVKRDYVVELQSQGVIRPHNSTTLTAQVSGSISSLSPSFEDGAYFKQGDVLLKIDTADYLTDLESAKAQLARAEAAFAQEEARAKQAQLNWKDAGFEEEASDLVLRKPQLREADANVLSAQSSLEKAERNLARTQVKAPYDGRVRKRNVGLGQQVGSSTPLGEIFSTDFAEVRLPLTTRDLTYYEPPSKPNSATSTNDIHFNSIISAKPDSVKRQWTGSILRTEGELDEDSKQLFVIARIDDPFGITSEKPPLYIGQPVRATIPAHTLKEVYVIPRKNLSGLNEILVIREEKLTRVSITPIWTDESSIVTLDGIEPDDHLCTTRLPYAPEGSPVSIIPEKDNLTAQKETSTPKKLKRSGPRRGSHK